MLAVAESLVLASPSSEGRFRFFPHTCLAASGMPSALRTRSSHRRTILSGAFSCRRLGRKVAWG